MSCGRGSHDWSRRAEVEQLKQQQRAMWTAALTGAVSGAVSGARSGGPQVRIGDAERDQAVTALGEHFVAGRLSKEELDERADAAWAARTSGDLAPLFRDLPAKSLEAMAQGAIQLEVPDGELLFAEGDEATSFFVVVDGTLELLRHKDGREVALRHTSRGEAFGLFGLFSAQLRAASARAIGDCTILELSAEQLQALLIDDEVLHQRLLGFYRERLVEGFMSGKLFTDIDSIARARLIGRFKNHELERGTALVTPGEVTNLLAVVTHGRLMIEDRARAGQEPKLYEVTQGQFLAVTGAMTGSPARLRVFAPEYACLSMLSQRDLTELLRDYPALRALPSRLPRFARALDSGTFCGSTGVPGL